jgi:phosphohistidine phosphatase
MNFCMIRHADAVPVDPTGAMKDADRPLTDKGLGQCKALAATLKRRGIVLGKLISSPYLRARQTAEEVLKFLTEPRPELLMCEHLIPDAKEKKLNRYLRTIEEETVTLVGHMPDLAVYAGWLIGSKKAQVAFAKAGVAWIECETGPTKGGGVLTWLLTPDWY